MTNRPDFIVDPSGNVQDVRRQTSWRYSGSSPKKPEKRDSGDGICVPANPRSTQKPEVSGGVIVIPIGLIITIIVAIVRLLNGQSPSHEPSYSEFHDLNSGIRYYLEDEYDMALVQFNGVIDAHPNSGAAYNGRGLVRLARGDCDEARAGLGRTIDLRPDWAGGYTNRGVTYYVEEEHDRAIAEFDKAIQLDADFAKAYYSRGLVYYRRNDYDAAIDDFTQAIEFTDEERYITRMGTRGAPDDPDQARLALSLTKTEGFVELMGTDADLALAYAGRGLAHLGKGDFAQAIADLDKASELGLDLDSVQ
jgi:tetratricopeptide (TPR) repeat protein